MKAFKHFHWLGLFVFVSLIGAVLAACASPPEEVPTPKSTEAPTLIPTDPPAQETESSQRTNQSGAAHSSKERDLLPSIADSELKTLSAGNSAFAIDLYQAVRDGGGNLLFSPYSISLALAMTYGGAMEQTAQQMAETLYFSLPDEDIHTGFNALDLELASRNNEDDETMPGFKLNIANSAWAQSDRPFKQDYLDLLAENYGAGLHLTDFVENSEGSRQAINDWISDETHGKIEDLIPAGAINTLTQLVLANAIYFNAGWQSTFDETLTEDGTFTLLDESQISAPMMSTSDPERFGYIAGENYQAVELPYNGSQLSMVILLPETGEYESFEANLDLYQLAEILKDLETKQVELQMPKFSFESEFGLVSVLRQLGMQAAFDPQTADFSGIDGTKELSISDVIHKAFISVDEEGTEAAAATAVVFRTTSMPITDIQMQIDQPFIFLVQDKPTGTILFLGRVLDPTR